MNKWFCIRGKKLDKTNPHELPPKAIQFFVHEPSKPKALIAASQAKTSYLANHPKSSDVEFEFDLQTAVSQMERDWKPDQLEGYTDDAIVIIAPYAGNGYQLQVIGEPSTPTSTYYILLKTPKGEGRWFETDDPAPYKEIGSIIIYNRRTYKIIAVLPATEQSYPAINE